MPGEKCQNLICFLHRLFRVSLIANAAEACSTHGQSGYEDPSTTSVNIRLCIEAYKVKRVTYIVRGILLNSMPSLNKSLVSRMVCVADSTEAIAPCSTLLCSSRSSDLIMLGAAGVVVLV
jgi:hypothetical protein